jgi:hypothetical protein
MGTPDMQGAKESAFTAVNFPENTLLVTFSKISGAVCSKMLAAFLEEKSIPESTLTDAVWNMPEGAWPLFLGEEMLLSNTLRFADDSGVIFLRITTRDDLCLFLDTCYRGDRMLMTDLSGRVVASSSSYVPGTRAERMSDVLEPSSRMALQSALEDGASGDEICRFTGMELETGRQYIVEPIVLNCPGNPVLIRLSDPSMCIDHADGDSEGLFEKLFAVIPVPAVTFDENGVITLANSSARVFFKESLGRDAESSLFLECLTKDSRAEAVSILDRASTAGTVTPVHFRAALSSTDGRIFSSEVTAVRLPGSGETAASILLSPSCGKDDGSALDTSALLAMLETRPRDEDLFRWVLELVRTGTGARGASCRLEGRIVTVGDVPLWDDSMGSIVSVETSSIEEDGSFCMTVPVRHRYGLLNLRLHGLNSTELQPQQRLVLKLAPVFIDYSYGIDSVNRVMRTFSSISDFWTLLSEQSGGVESMLERMADISRSDSILLSVLKEGESALVPISGYGYAADLPILSLEDDTVASWAYTHNELTYMADSGRDSRFVTVYPGAGSELAIPLLRGGRPAATLTASSRHQGGYTKPLPSLMNMMGTMISLWLYGGGGDADLGLGADRVNDGMEKTEIDSLLLSLSQRLRSPLAALSANVELLCGGSMGILDPEQFDSLQSMHRSIADLTTQCERLMTFMRLELQDDAGESSWARPSELVSSLLPGLKERGRQKDVTVTAELPDEPFTACFDSTRMEQIVSNLIDNAIAYNRPGGKVQVIVGLDNDVWTLEVSDTGQGIRSSELPCIFDGFHSRQSSGEPGEGLGIGLAIVKRFTELQGGVISVWSSENVGSRFILRFPLSG